MSKYNSWEEFMKGEEESLLQASVSFEFMKKGIAYFKGNYKNLPVTAKYGEHQSISDLSFSFKEKVSMITQGDIAFLQVGDEILLNIH